MTKNIIKEDGEFDLLKMVEKSPQLTRYIIRNRVSEVKKNAIIVAIIASALSFACGFMVGMNIFNISQPKNIVEVQVEKTNG